MTLKELRALLIVGTMFRASMLGKNADIAGPENQGLLRLVVFSRPTFIEVRYMEGPRFGVVSTLPLKNVKCRMEGESIVLSDEYSDFYSISLECGPLT